MTEEEMLAIAQKIKDGVHVDEKELETFVKEYSKMLSDIDGEITKENNLLKIEKIEQDLKNKLQG
jgi:hypothetical protein